MIKTFFKNNFWVLLIYALLLSTALFFILNFEKVSINVYLNQLVGNPFVNGFFYWITYLGDGNVAIILLILILLYNIRLGICATFSFLTAALVSNSLKYFFFDDVNRPAYIYRYIKSYPIKYVDGLDLHIHNSFPSGHATQAFAIFMCLVFATTNSYLKFSFFIIAFLTAFSRVYLSQHWLVDITVGSMIGFSFSLLYDYLIIHRNKLLKLNKSVFELKRAN